VTARIRRLEPTNGSIETWTRDVEGLDADVLGVTATLTDAPRWPWRVIVQVLEFVRGDPLESDLARLITTALAGVERVTQVKRDDRELWIVDGSPEGYELVEAVSIVVDGLARQTRAHIDALEALDE
jgi:hypothetical protein